MPPREVPAEEPFESRDLALGRALRSWADAHATSMDLELEGPLDAPGMDPTWMLRMSGPLLYAEVHLFYGPHVDITAVRTDDPDAGFSVGGEDGLTGPRLVEMLDDLEQMGRGEAPPMWLRTVPPA
ncbi:hypothetical protein ACQP00_29605 [Dactylosporangium sp. CS-047395]|uniref:hypothetical protein n=1 Tax=Dactylosporangium sp. CS-047395 TaxID=3239936 RepID=UPI003D931E40